MNTFNSLPNPKVGTQRDAKTGIEAFTLIEILAATAVLAVIMTLTLSVVSQVQSTLRNTQSKSEQFRAAREGFESITRRLSQATLNTYWDYDDPTNPKRYLRCSELRFRLGPSKTLLPDGTQTTTHSAFFQAPFGFTEDPDKKALNTLLNTWGYFLEFGSDQNFRPTVLPPSFPLRYRFRLHELSEPSEELSVYRYTSGNPAYSGMSWFQTPLSQTPRPTRVIVENIVALIFWPKDSYDQTISGDYSYDSSPDANPSVQSSMENQLPPMVQVSMVAIDESSAQRLSKSFGTNMPPLVSADWFTRATTADYKADMQALQGRLSSGSGGTRGINYRLFSSKVLIRGARWSKF